jgi:hypothetical protein
MFSKKEFTAKDRKNCDFRIDWNAYSTINWINFYFVFLGFASLGQMSDKAL